MQHDNSKTRLKEPKSGRRSLSRDLIVSLIVCAVLVTVIINLFSLWYQTRQTQKQYALKAEEYATYLVESLQLPLWNFDFEMVNKIAGSVYNNDLVARLVIKDDAGEHLFDMQKPREAIFITRNSDIMYNEKYFGSIELGLTSRLYRQSVIQLLVTNSLTILLIVAVLVVVTNVILNLLLKRPLETLLEEIKRVSTGDFEKIKTGYHHREINTIVERFNSMLESLRQAKKRNDYQSWLKTGQTQLNERMWGESDPDALGDGVISYLARFLRAQIGILYIANGDGYTITGTYGVAEEEKKRKRILSGEGLVGQTALGTKPLIVDECPEDYYRIKFSAGSVPPRQLLIFPLLLNDEVQGVLELGTLDWFSEQDMAFLELVAESIAIALNSMQSRRQIAALQCELPDRGEL